MDILLGLPTFRLQRLNLSLVCACFLALATVCRRIRRLCSLCGSSLAFDRGILTETCCDRLDILPQCALLLFTRLDD